MREAWGCESQFFRIIRIKHAITNNFVWQEPHKFICDGCTYGAQIVQRPICIYFGNPIASSILYSLI